MRVQGVSRRAAFKVGGGLAVAAQEASPVASPSAGGDLEGRYVAVRIRTLADA